ncbi:peptide-methionine (S)-S-oxide reductase MsrA [bacterium]|nr:peptide-methionine (S)-S-oxide reductase MsrA [bacterium]
MDVYLAGGCFWCINMTIKETPGVKDVVVGYSGGDEENPKYEDVKSQKTGHRETIKVTFDENIISYPDLLDVFLLNVDPFDEFGQFIDRGHSYTLAIYYKNEYEKNIASMKIAELENFFNKKAYISIEPFKSFYIAEEYHQDFYKKHKEEFEKELIESGRIKKMTDYKLLNNELKEIIRDVECDISNFANASSLIFNTLDNLNWAGFYLLDNDYLYLGPFQGKVACTKIKVGSGVCGTSVFMKKTLVVPNVLEFKGHIACDSNSKSEIVIPMIKDDKIIGVLDIDSPIFNRFSEEDKIGLEEFVKILLNA